MLRYARARLQRFRTVSQRYLLAESCARLADTTSCLVRANGAGALGAMMAASDCSSSTSDRP